MSAAAAPPRKNPGARPGLQSGVADLACRLHLSGAGAAAQAMDQPRARERIMKVSMLYSAICHQRNWSLRKATIWS
jgi:hypothetical protein